MTPGLEETDIQCPYCGETISILIDTSVTDQTYIEDCRVCCRPINFNVAIDIDDHISLTVSHENDAC